MKNVLILHGSFGNPDKNWYPYVGKKAQAKGYVVHIPQLTHIDKLDLDKTYTFLIEQNFINSETVLIGHSSGAAYILGIFQRVTPTLVLQKAILVAGFVDAHLTDELFQVVSKEHYYKLFPPKWDWEKIKNSCKKFIIIQSNNDPYVQMRHAEFLTKKLNGKLVIIKNGRHFSVSTGGNRFKEFPEIIYFLK